MPVVPTIVKGKVERGNDNQSTRPPRPRSDKSPCPDCRSISGSPQGREKLDRRQVRRTCGVCWNYLKEFVGDDSPVDPSGDYPGIQVCESPSYLLSLRH